MRNWAHVGLSLITDQQLHILVLPYQLSVLTLRARYIILCLKTCHRSPVFHLLLTTFQPGSSLIKQLHIFGHFLYSS